MSAKRKLAHNVSMASQGMDLGGLREFARNHPANFARMTQDLIEKGELRWRDIADLKALWRATADAQVETFVMLHGEQRTVMSSAFPVLAGNLTVAGINDAYMGVPTIGEELVTDFDSVKETATIMGLLAESKQDLERKEGEPFAKVGAGEERFDIGSNPKGLAMDITQEMIDRNDVENVMARVNFLGEVPAEQIEKTTLREVTDHDGSAATGTKHTLTLNKTGAALYSTTANTPGTRAPSGTRVANNALTTAANLEAARIRLAKMLNSRGERIMVDRSEIKLLAPIAVQTAAEQILNSQWSPGVVGEFNPWGPTGDRRPSTGFLLTSPKLDDLSTTAWYYGAFRKQFRRKWALRIETVTQSGDLTKYLENRIAFSARVAWDCKVGATDYVYVLQNLTATTAPKDA